MSAAESNDFGPYAFSLTADEARIAAARAGLRRALAGGLTAAHFAPLAAFVLAILFVAILALTGLLGRRPAEAALLVCAAAFLVQRLATRRRFFVSRRLAEAEIECSARRRPADAEVEADGLRLDGGLRRRAGVSPIASRPRTPAASSICGRARARRRSRRPASFMTIRKRHASRNSCARGCRAALPVRRRTTRTPPATQGAGIDAHRDDWRRLCRLGLGGLLRRLRSRRRLRRQGRRQDRGAQGRPIADLRAGPERTRRRQPARRPAVVHRRHSRRNARRAGGLHLRRHADAAGRRRRRHALRLSGGARDRRSDRGLRRRRQQVDVADRRLRRNRAHRRRTRAARNRSPSPAIRNSCAKARRSTISSSPTGW